MSDERPASSDWRAQRRTGIAAIAVSVIVSALIWLAIFYFGPEIAGGESLGVRLLFAFKCIAVATLFCLVGGIESVSHERLQSAAFDPLAGVESRRLRVNVRYLQNTLEQLIVFAVGLVGLAVYLTDGHSMRAVLATMVVWILGRFAFWIGYHRSAALRGLGAPTMMLGLLVLLYVAWRIGLDAAGPAGGVALLGAFAVLEAVLFWTTRSRD